MKRSTFFLIAGIIVVIDQIVKFLIRTLVDDPIPLIGSFLTIINTTNVGAGFGILQGKRLYLVVVSLVVIGMILYYHRSLVKEKWNAIGFSLILGGAIGNLVDRVIFAGVTDFFNFSFFPAFNVADSAISIGAVILVAVELKSMFKKKEA